MNRTRKEEKGFEAFPAVVVADNTNKRGKRLAQLGVGLLVLFFAVSSYVQAARNGALLEDANRDRSNLITSTERITRTLDQQTQQIMQLQAAIRAQNDALRKAGIKTVPVPGVTTRPEPTSTETPTAFPRPEPGVSPRPQPRPSSSGRPQPRPTPSPSPSPSPTPLIPVEELICQLTGICI